MKNFKWSKKYTIITIVVIAIMAIVAGGFGIYNYIEKNDVKEYCNSQIELINNIDYKFENETDRNKKLEYLKEIISKKNEYEKLLKDNNNNYNKYQKYYDEVTNNYNEKINTIREIYSKEYDKIIADNTITNIEKCDNIDNLKNSKTNLENLIKLMNDDGIDITQKEEDFNIRSDKANELIQSYEKQIVYLEEKAKAEEEAKTEKMKIDKEINTNNNNKTNKNTSSKKTNNSSSKNNNKNNSSSSNKKPSKPSNSGSWKDGLIYHSFTNEKGEKSEWYQHPVTGDMYNMNGKYIGNYFNPD